MDRNRGTTIEQVVHYQELSAEYLRHARALLADGDLTAASEKGWEAASVSVKAAAEARGMEHSRHGHLWRVVRALVRETGDAEIRGAFSSAESLHVNFDEVWMEREDVEYFMGDVERLVGKLHDLASVND